MVYLLCCVYRRFTAINTVFHKYYCKSISEKNLIFFMAMMPFYLQEKVQRPLKVIIFGDGTIRTLKSLYTFGRT